MQHNNNKTNIFGLAFFCKHTWAFLNIFDT